MDADEVFPEMYCRDGRETNALQQFLSWEPFQLQGKYLLEKVTNRKGNKINKNLKKKV